MVDVMEIDRRPGVAAASPTGRAMEAIRSGDVLYLPHSAFPITNREHRFLDPSVVKQPRRLVLALDGFATEISAVDLAAYDWIVAVKRDGRYLDIGQRGPLWIVYARRDGKAIGEDDEQRWPWAFLIEVK